MNYEKVILELLLRIQVLEEQVADLINQKENTVKKEDNKMTMQEIRDYIQDLKRQAKENGQTSITLISGDIHKELNLKNYMPPVCNAMRQCMEVNDIVLHTTDSGNSSTIKIEYKL